MKNCLVAILFVNLILYCSSHPLCSDGSTAVPLNNLQFCTQYASGSCCSLTRDAQIQTNFNALGISASSTCGQQMKKIMCGECDPWAAHLVGEKEDKRQVPFLCTGFCGAVYDACSDVQMNQSPFGTPTISTTYNTKTSFCTEYGVAGVGYCYQGVPYVEEDAPVFNSTSGLCLDRVVAQRAPAWLSMSEINDGSKRVGVVTREGIMKLFKRTTEGPWTDLGVALNLTSRVRISGEGGLLAIAFHPNFATNRKFYLSYICDPTVFSDCQSSCTSDTECVNGGKCVGGTCSDHVGMAIIAEYLMADATSNTAIPNENKRILAISRPGTNHNGGQILFGPDGYLYYFSGDGGGNAHLGSQDPKGALGKVLRVDVNTPANKPYNVPSDNPFVANNPKGFLTETYAYGFRNPWRSSFDRLNGKLILGDVGQDLFEEVNVVTKGKNYGWRKYEGNRAYYADNIEPVIPDAVFPVASYQHGWNGRAPACIIGGYVYRGAKDGCAYGKYIFGDLDGYLFSSHVETDGGFQTPSPLSYACGSNPTSTLSCLKSALTIQTIYSFGEDLDGNLYLLTNLGILSVVNPSKCPSLVCSQTPVDITTTTSVPTTPTEETTTGSSTTGQATSTTAQATSTTGELSTTSSTSVSTVGTTANTVGTTVSTVGTTDTVVSDNTMTISNSVTNQIDTTIGTTGSVDATSVTTGATTGSEGTTSGPSDTTDTTDSNTTDGLIDDESRSGAVAQKNNIAMAVVALCTIYGYLY